MWGIFVLDILAPKKDIWIKGIEFICTCTHIYMYYLEFGGSQIRMWTIEVVYIQCSMCIKILIYIKRKCEQLLPTKSCSSSWLLLVQTSTATYVHNYLHYIQMNLPTVSICRYPYLKYKINKRLNFWFKLITLIRNRHLRIM